MQNKLRVRRQRQWVKAFFNKRLVIVVRNFPILWGRDHEPEHGLLVWQLGCFCVIWVVFEE